MSWMERRLSPGIKARLIDLRRNVLKGGIEKYVRQKPQKDYRSDIMV